MIFLWETKNITSENITFEMLTPEVIEGYLNWLETDRKNMFNTRNARLAAIRSFSKYAVNHDFEAASQFNHDMSKIEAKKGVGNELSYFSPEEVKLLIDIPKLNTVAGRRNATIFVFMFATGARAQEVCDLLVKDVQFIEEGRARITLHGKGNKTRKVIVCSEVSSLLKRYIKYRRITECPMAYVFNTQNHPQMSVSCLEEIYKKYITIAKAEYPTMFKEKYSPHSMRHSTAMSMLSAGVSLSAIRVFLGHNHISTTEIYAKITQPELEKAIRDWNQSFWENIEEDQAQAKPSQRVQSEKNVIIPEFLL